MYRTHVFFVYHCFVYLVNITFCIVGYSDEVDDDEVDDDDDEVDEECIIMEQTK